MYEERTVPRQVITSKTLLPFWPPTPSEPAPSPATLTPCETSDLVCFAPLPWDFHFQRANHLVRCFAKYRRVYYIEEPLFDSTTTHARVSLRENRLRVVTPHLLSSATDTQCQEIMTGLLRELEAEENIKHATFWYLHPAAYSYSRHLNPALIVYDRIDEIPGRSLMTTEAATLREELLKHADLVFTPALEAHRPADTSSPTPLGISPAPSQASRESLALNWDHLWQKMAQLECEAARADDCFLRSHPLPHRLL